MVFDVDAVSGNIQSITLFILLQEQVGALNECLQVLKECNVSMTRIESRPSKSVESGYEFLIDIDMQLKDAVQNVIEEIKKVDIVRDVHNVSSLEGLNDTEFAAEKVPWFPRKISDLDTFINKVLEFGKELSSDHPGAQDPVYRQRRQEIVEKARMYRTGQPLPRIEYTEKEKNTWKYLYTRLHDLYPKYACHNYRQMFDLLEQKSIFTPDEIPQIEDISNFLKERTGFTLRPVMGQLSSRDFLSSLAFRVFHSTQYVRHHSDPLYTPEPDCCHEFLGHVPMLADPCFAELAQEIGLASLGASDEDIKRLAAIFWYTVEFGICRENGDIRVYGAALLSSYGELEYAFTKIPEKRSFEPSEVANQTYPLTEYQPIYFITNSFCDATSKLRDFSMTIERPFQIRYDPYTQTVQVFDSKDQMPHLA
ncbi:hypothetical protein IWW36_002973 [Coemansia brasiliensis]|uniref:phenylalanine 4-monooxygenase n=1 Tax=Coemansia brasiliensis TaxID=2650707 RepID=A0A9W8ICI4_9FUNG|nr:hypothetical protein IWW36_002973 [Coemansia brasiliensis]